jgi:hypothetical protein
MKSKRKKHETVIEKIKQQTNKKQNEENSVEKMDENKVEETTQDEIKVRGLCFSHATGDRDESYAQYYSCPTNTFECFRVSLQLLWIPVVRLESLDPTVGKFLCFLESFT